jgi:PLP dependent protein
MSIAENIARVQEQIQAATLRTRRNPDEISLMAVTKTVAPERIRQAYAAGIRLFGENRVQEFQAKHNALRDLSAVQWHMIGHLQTNKAAAAAELFGAIDSLDSLRLAQKINAAAAQLNKKIPVLIEINIGGEEAKSGLGLSSPDLEALLNYAPQLPALEFCGLMTVPPYDPEKSRPYFRRMRELFTEISSRGLPAITMKILSMGMSHDFEIAIEEGSTCVRVGTAIFGERVRSQP